MSDPLFDPLRRTLQRNLKRYMIGKTLGFCPRTGETIDVDSAVWVLDPDGDPYMALSQRGWKQVLDTGVVPDLLAAGYAPEADSIKDPDVRALSVPNGLVERLISPDQLTLPEA